MMGRSNVISLDQGVYRVKERKNLCYVLFMLKITPRFSDIKHHTNNKCGMKKTVKHLHFHFVPL